MKIAIISDIHENSHNLVLFYRKAQGLGVEKILFLGDLVNGGIALMIANSKIPTFMVWGNNDGDKVSITKIASKKGSNLEVGFTTFDKIELDNKKIFLTHYAMLARPMAKSGEFDLVCYGHSHIRNLDKIGNCLVVNPGQLGGKEGAFALYDTQLHTLQIIELENCISLKSNIVDEYRKEIGVERPFDEGREY